MKLCSKPTTVTFAICCLWCVATAPADVVFPPQDFSDGNAGGWQGADPVVVPNGGPLGEGDAYLEVLSTAVGRPGSRAAVYNALPFWTDNLPGSAGFNFDMASFPDSPADLEMRLVLLGLDTGNRWTSTDPIVVPNDGNWRPYSFPLNEEDFTQVAGTATFDETIADVGRIMLRHDAGEPSAGGTAVAATIGLDNLEIDLGPCFFGFCDVNADGACNVADLDSLMGTIASGVYDESVDVNSDGVINDAERDFVLGELSSRLGFVGPLLLGDSNLDGVVNVTDLNALALNWQTDNTNWSGGNFVSLSGAAGVETNVSDLNALALNWQQAVPIAADATHSVPEPNAAWLLLVAVAALSVQRRKATHK